MIFEINYDVSGSKKQQKQLQQLLSQYQQAGNQEEEQLVILEIVELALQFRCICRENREKPLADVLSELFQKAETFLLAEVEKQLTKANCLSSITCHWLNQAQLKSFKRAINDQTLKQIAILAKKSPKNSSQRRYFLTVLVQIIQLYNRFCRPHFAKFNRYFYPLIHDEAIGKTLIYICEHIDNYDPERGEGRFINWVNFILTQEVIACRRDFDLSHKYDFVSAPDFSHIADAPGSTKIADLLYQCIKEDKCGIYQKFWLGDNPQANFRDIALYRLDGMSWQTISERLNCPVSSLSGFYRRTYLKIQHLLRKDLEDIQMF